MIKLYKKPLYCQISTNLGNPLQGSSIKRTIYNPDGTIKEIRHNLPVAKIVPKKEPERKKHIQYYFKRFKKCSVCFTKKGKWHKHHIVYNPEQIVRLCFPCHATITSLNTTRREQAKRPLTNKERLHIFWDFVDKKRSKRNFKELNKHLKNGQEIFLSHYKNNAMDTEFLSIVHR